jgi:hypothetical protein
MRRVPCFVLLGAAGLLLTRPGTAGAQTAEDVTAVIERIIALDSVDVGREVRFRAGLEPSLFDYDADEKGMRVLSSPYEVQGQGQPAAAGWYRVRFTVPDRLGKFEMPKNGYTCGVEINCLGAWESYTYVNGKPAGLWSKDGMQMNANQRPTVWMSTAPMPIKPGDEVVVSILAMASPLGRGSPEGYALRHLRLRFAYSHTAGRAPLLGSVQAPGIGTGLFGLREMLATKQGDELAALQAKAKEPLARLATLFAAAETGRLEELTKAMLAASKEINEALKK